MEKLYASIGMALLMGACGGGTKRDSTSPDPGYVYGQEEEHEETDELIPEEKFDLIKNTFERKASTVARCFPEAVAAGELGSDDRVKVMVGLVIQPDGSATQLKILAASKRSKTLEACVMKSVSRWEFTTLPKPLEYSYGFVMQRF